MKSPESVAMRTLEERAQAIELRKKLQETEVEMMKKEENFAATTSKMCQDAKGMVELTMSHADQRHREIMQQTTGRAQDAVGVPAEPTYVDDHSGRGRSGATSDVQPRTSCSNGSTNHGAQAEDGGDDEGHQSWCVREATEEEMQGIQRDAPWVTKIGPGKVWNNAIRMQLEEEDLPEEQRRIHPRYWLRDEEGTWKYHRGILPSSAPQEGAMVDLWQGRRESEDFLDEVDRTLQKGCRKRLLRRMRQVKVSEVYSRPRISEKAAEEGLEQGSAFDLLTGYDFRKRTDRHRCWKKLKEEDPDLLVVCPPCGPFSRLQNLNYSKMNKEKAICMVAEGLEHLDFSMRLFEWQVRRGKWALFEHPMTSAAWDEESVQRATSLEGVEVVRGDQCMYGLRVREGEERSKKATKFMSNSKEVLKEVSMRCDGTHSHQELIGGRAKKAEEYPPELCKAVVEGIKKEASLGKVVMSIFPSEDLEEEGEGLGLEDALDDAVEAGGEAYPRRMRGQGNQELPEESSLRRSSGEEAAEEEEEEKDENPRGITDQDRRLVKRLHQNLGHPSKEDFCRALRMAKAREEVVRYVKEDFRCGVCDSKQLPKAARPSTIPRHFETGKVVGVDVVYFPGVEARQSTPVLNIIDWASCYQMLEPIDTKSSQHVWTKFWQSWARTFGVPEVIVVDQGKEFLGEFGKNANEAGAVVRTIGARAPWQQGGTERHGGLAKAVFMEVRDQMQPENVEEWRQCIYATEMAKNRLFNRSGFSPAQRQMGCNIRIPGSLAGDDVYDSSLMRSTSTSEVRRLHEEFLRHTSRETIRRAEKARPRVVRDFKSGDKVFVFRKPIPKRGDDQARELRKAVWCGPGVVITTEGANVWISMRGELWKCAKEQVRSATPEEEEEAFGLLQDEYEELAKTLQRRGSKRGFKDISQWDVRGDEDWEDEEAERETHWRRVEESAEAEMEPESVDPGGQGNLNIPGESSTAVAQPGHQALPPVPGSSEGSSTSDTSSSDSKEEPEQEQIEIEEGALDDAAKSVANNEALDGNPNPRSYQPERVKERLRSFRWKPYTASWWAPQIEEEEEAEDEEMREDFWQYCEETGRLSRMHRVERTGDFFPNDKRGCPIKAKMLTSWRRTRKQFDDGGTRAEQSNWRNPKVQSGPHRCWIGVTEFQLKPGRD